VQGRGGRPVVEGCHSNLTPYLRPRRRGYFTDTCAGWRERGRLSSNCAIMGDERTQDMKTSDDILAYLRQSRERFAQLYRVRRIGIFGSAARGDRDEGR